MVARSRAGLRRGLQGAAVQNHRRRLCLASREFAQEHAQILDHGFETSGANPALRLLIDHRPGRQIAGHVAPLAAGAHDEAQAVEHRAKTVLPLLAVLPAQRQVWNHKGPLLVRHITGIADLPLVSHPSIVSDGGALGYCFDSKGIKLITGV